MVISYSGYSVHHRGSLSAIRTGKQLHCPQRHLQHFDADKWYHRNHLLHQQPARHLVLGWYLAGGIIDLILGIYLVAYPLLSMEVIPFIVAFWMMFRGFSATGYSMDLKRYGTREWGWYMGFGILAIICSLIILWQPAVGALYVIYMLAFTFLIIGFFRVMLSFELKSLHKRSTVMNGK